MQKACRASTQDNAQHSQRSWQHTLSLMLTIALYPFTILLSLIPYRCHDAYMDLYTSYEHIHLGLLPFLDFFGKVCH